MPYNFHVKRLFSANCRPRPLTINPQKLNRFWFVELRFQRNLFCLNTQSLGPRQLNLTHKCNKISKINGNFTENTDQKAYFSYRLTITIIHIRKNVFCQMKACSDIHSAFRKNLIFLLLSVDHYHPCGLQIGKCFVKSTKNSFLLSFQHSLQNKSCCTTYCKNTFSIV